MAMVGLLRMVGTIEVYLRFSDRPSALVATVLWLLVVIVGLSWPRVTLRPSQRRGEGAGHGGNR